MAMADTAETAGAAQFSGRARPYWHLLTRGALFLLLTLGLYRFWLATEIRRYLWGHTDIAGEPLEYTGTPLELLVGFLFAAGILIPVYSLFFIAALDLGPAGELSGAIGFVITIFLGHYAAYRARRYRLTRSVYRGLRFHQDGSAWRYAVIAFLWWIATALTLGLAFPWHQRSLERYKIGRTYYGQLPARFSGSAAALFLRGLPLWLLAMTPVAIAVNTLATGVDWATVGEIAERGGDDAFEKLWTSSTGFADAIVSAGMTLAAALLVAIFLFPAFQTILLRWWLNGIRFDGLRVTSRLGVFRMYGIYLRFVMLLALFALVLALAAIPTLLLAGYLTTGENVSALREALAAGMLLAGYVIAALGLSTIYQATVRLPLWRAAVDTLTLDGVSALHRVQAADQDSSAFGEGLADALHTGGY